MKADGSIDKYMIMLVIKDYRQLQYLYCFDTYSLVTKINFVRMVLVIDAMCNLEIHQMNVKTTFLNRDLDEKIYIEQPEDFIAPGRKRKSIN